ncbi:hypothetical protein [Pseudodesulfovibrio senegalensis]|uniref:APC family permease n=1 Tax=Pseudodesulfovibrio senegalensis TaxID=1721087 RepID=A0A6N6N1G9_9BACT|nr:hypothetical protein [Pseudodesulfovibrio senegalensis]KAB1440339.1 hypothetical protein F8A88_13905 [Pseudodesulfovibrio senegalensis]
MPLSDLVVIVTALLVGGFLLFYRPLAQSSAWRATITPLASIMGSGFLVCAPLLYANVGNYAVCAMGGLLVLAYGVGAVIRFNIRYGEPVLAQHCSAGKGATDQHPQHMGHCHGAQRCGPAGAAGLLEKVSHIVLAGAYCISVSYYLQLLAGFGLKYFSLESGWYGKGLVTLILVGVGAVGTVRGLKGIERVERVVVGINLAMIAALVAGLIHYNATAALIDGTWQLHALASSGDAGHVVRMVMGMLIVVQGFETSRFLGAEHSAEERIRTMRTAQLVSTAIYVAFVGLMALVIGRTGLDNSAGITAIVNYSGVVAPILPLLLTLTAVGSQFSAATADDAGCSGLLEAILKGLIPVKFNYLVVSVAAIVITWLTDVYQIISYASRAFALFYVLQCAVAVLILRRVAPSYSFWSRVILFGFLGLSCLGVTIFGIPAE